MDEVLVPIIVFFASASGLVTVVAGLRIATRWATRRLETSPDVAEQVAELEERVAELEERADFAERALGDLKSRRQLGSGNE